MARWILVNNVQLGTSLHTAGDVFDDVQEDITRVLLSGGMLVPSTPFLEGVAALLQAGRKAGVAPDLLAGMMTSVREEFANTVDSTTATNTATAVPRHESFKNPQAAGVVLKAVVETDAAVSVTTALDAPSNLQVVWDVGWSGGDLTISGTGPDGVAVSELFVKNPGGTTVGVKAFATIDANGIVDATPAGAGADTASVQTGALLGLAAPTATTAYKLTVDGVAEAIVAQVGANRTVQPTTAKVATKQFDVWYLESHTHAQAAHSHTLS